MPTFTREIPKEDGYYWARGFLLSDDAEPVRLLQRGDGRRDVEILGSNMRERAIPENFIWGARIQAPEEAEPSTRAALEALVKACKEESWRLAWGSWNEALQAAERVLAREPTP